EGSPGFRGKHEVVLLPSRPGGAMILELSCSMFSEAIDDGGRQRKNPPARLALWLREAPAAAFPLGQPMQGMRHAKASTIEIDVCPAEREQLAESQAEVHRYAEGCLQAASPSSPE